MKMEKIRGLLGLARRARTVTMGSRETRTGLRRGAVRAVVLARDGSPRDRERLRRVAAEEGVPVIEAGTRETLGAAVGRDGVSVIGLTDRHLAEAVVGKLEDSRPGDRSGGDRRETEC